MDAAFYDLLTELVTFRVIGAPGLHGRKATGVTVGPVKCRISTPNRSTRTAEPRQERETHRATIYVPPESFDPTVVLPGSECVLPMGRTVTVDVVDFHYAEDGSVDHYRIQVA